ncbi:phenylalanine--tRNA ligase subunit beta [Thermocrinis minervae]|uniref:Phenylalanine--tRNA ligase beta subunit n=1 Tax=Thermocrinis minervae TaxID=381751 RepID=A0A1M6Q358_9AQUI|nr:phenylalanine--tRNA ligase subunit beta [Thermocrinis minervae]SHK14672.1 phenylalanyl-tRNA synthetase beta subunit [Thermocrinis minervae]
MRIPYSWLYEFIDIQDVHPQEVAHILTLKSVETIAYLLDIRMEGVVTGKIVQIEPLDKGLYCTVQVGENTFIKVYTRDNSVKVGDGVIVALPNARIGNICIQKREFEGKISEGMFLSAKELGLEDRQEGVIRFEENIKPGTDAYGLLGFGEWILEVEITPNRGDLLSVKGLAREIGALLGRDRKNWNVEELEDIEHLNIRIEDEDCSRYSGALLVGVSVKESPLWMRKRLWQCGIRSINNVVDITNYVMLKYGQPLHAFDYDKIEGSIVVRSARKGESINTLTGGQVELSEDNLVIADDVKPLAIAGVVGGLESAVQEGTKKVLLESAYFNPYRIRRSSKAVGIQTDSSYRFERNVDIQGVKTYQTEAIKLMLELTGAQLVALKDVYPRRYMSKEIFLPLEKFRRYTGEDFNREQISSILSRLEIPHEVSRCGLQVYVPSFRSFDIKEDVDIIEEIMRVKGYESFSSEVLSIPCVPKKSSRDVASFLAARGCIQVINFSFEDEELYDLMGLERPQVKVVNPLTKSQSLMRTSLLPGLIRTALLNQNRHNYDMCIFEVGKVYTQEGEEERVGILMTGLRKLYPKEEYDAYKLLSLVEDLLRHLRVDFNVGEGQLGFLHPYVQTTLKHKDKSIGFLGELHPSIRQRLELRGRVFVAELSLADLESYVPSYKELSKFPPVIRDIALVVDRNLPVDRLLLRISELSNWVEDVKVFDVYTDSRIGEGKKSISIRIVLRSKEGSISDEEANAFMEKLISTLKKEFGAELRG